MSASDPLPTPPEKPVVLVIDDELGPRESLRFLLKDDYVVSCWESVDRGIQCLRATPPDLVIMDIRMPVKNGIEGLREIRQIDPDVAVVMLTGFAALGTAQEAIRNEANDYVEKPFDTTEMRQTVRRHVEQTRVRRKRRSLLAESSALDDRIRKLNETHRMAELGQSSSEFVHDLRNALATITGASSLLRMEVDDLRQRSDIVPDEVDRYLNSLENSMRRCVEMLDAWQGLIADRPQPFVRFRAHGFVRSCVEACRPSAESAGARMECLECGEDAELSGDTVQLSRVLSNLMHNALRALPPRGGWVRVRSETTPGTVTLTVSDNGCGIPPEYLERIFAPNFTTRRESGGMGLGLFIARKIAQAHKGQLTVSSTVGQGSTFTLVLPRAGTPDGAAPV